MIQSGADAILDQKRDEIINKLESDLKTLETKNLELKYANRNLISTVSEQKNMLKALQTEITRLESSKVKEHSFEKLNTEHKKLMDNYKNLQIQYKELQEEISNLKNLIPESKSNNGLFARFLKRKPTDEDEEDEIDDGTLSDETKK
jgi:DNA repair exonuclease SbcCD ATPase subunit